MSHCLPLFSVCSVADVGQPGLPAIETKTIYKDIFRHFAMCVCSDCRDPAPETARKQDDDVDCNVS